MRLCHAVGFACVIAGSTLVLAECRQDKSPLAPRPAAERTVDAELRAGRAATSISVSLISTAYTCANYFRVRNANTSVVTLGYTVAGSSEHGTLVLAAKPGAYAFSETYLSTAAGGTVTLTYNGAKVVTLSNGGKACAVAAIKGSWTTPTPWPIVGIHAALLPNGTVMTWGRTEISPAEEPRVWNPAADPQAQKAQAQFAVATNPFCSGHAILSDGRLLVAGGHLLGDSSGRRSAFTFDARTSVWTQQRDMRAGRWYPTVTALANGEMLVEAGTDSLRSNNRVPEVLQLNGTWRELTRAARNARTYPWNFVAPNGQVFSAGAQPSTQYIATSGTGTLGSIIPRVVAVTRDYGSAVMYDAGKILVMGGGNTEASAEVIDLTVPQPQWKRVSSMAYARRQLSAVIQADGQVLVSGGAAGPVFNPSTNIALVPEVWNPTTTHWTPMAPMHVPRLYHSNTLLLPDARILSVGGGQPVAAGQPNQFNAEFYSPPYLFNPDGTLATASRPIVTGLPATVGYGQTFTVQTQNVIAAKVLWIRLGSVTHAFNENQRLNALHVTQNGGALAVTAPATANLAPPGHYLLFVLNAHGTPSVGRIVQIH